jgi:peptide/nickel transport system substrate-binding protein
MNTPHPILSDIKVREAIAKGIDRQTIADKFYGFEQSPTPNIVNGAPEIESPNTSWEFNLEAAAKALDEAGWVLDGDVRKKDGAELKLTYVTSVNSVRQKTQSLVKSNLESIGFAIELQQVDAAVFFDSGAGNDQNAVHFYSDLSEQQNLPNSPRPIEYMELWYAGPDKSNIAQKSNSWSGGNWVRYQNDDYDAALEAARAETDPEKLADLFITMNDILIGDHAVVPLVLRGTPGAHSTRLRAENIAPAPFSYDYWNIANWNLADGAGE